MHVLYSSPAPCSVFMNKQLLWSNSVPPVVGLHLRVNF